MSLSHRKTAPHSINPAVSPADAGTAVGHDHRILVDLFSVCFEQQFNTRLVANASVQPQLAREFATEPVYLPTNPQCPFNRIVFAHGFFSSALHEIAHWCIAGKARRRLVDYGYWYEPDDRNADQQAEFERVEVKPQAIEWAFCLASGYPFEVSADNLSSVQVDRAGFRAKVHAQLTRYFTAGFPPRAKHFIEALCSAHGRRLERPVLA